MSSRHAPPPPPLGGLPCSVLPSLLSLSLRFARVGDAGAAHLADAFVAGGGGSLTCLRLEGNTIGCAGCERLAASLAALPALRVLGFGDALGGNAIGDAGMCALASALAQTERDLIELAPDASGPPVVGAGHALRELGLHNNRIGSRGARALARALAAGGARARRRPTSCAARRVPSHARERRVPKALHTWPSSARAATASGRRPWRSWRALEQGCGQTARRRTRRGEASREVSAGLRDSNLRPCVLQQQLCRLVCAVVCGCIDNLRSLECCR
uniref:Uncharacterized protein n=1 Tax=Emiliania huxleyi TaxID=2903 RepID=A0A7S3WMT3_EMIHU